MNDTLKKILLGKDILVIPYEEKDPISKNEADQLIGSIEYSFASVWYSLSAKAIDVLKTLGKSELTAFYQENFSLLKTVKGVNANHVVFYKNFPEGVLSMSEGELYLRASLHYLSVFMKDIGASDYTYMADDIAKEPRLPFTDALTPVLLSVIREGKESEEIIVEYAKNILGSPVAMSDKNIADIEAIREDIPNADSLIRPSKFQFKETLAYWVKAMVAKYGLSYVFSKASGVIDFSSMTATDILRVYGIVSDGNATITTQNIKYISLPRSARRFILETLDNICKKFESETDLLEDEFGTHNFRWNCVFRQLHAGEYSAEFPYIGAIVNDCRSHSGCTTIASSIDSIISGAMNNGLTCQEALDKIVLILSKKPGVFARRLDSLLRNKIFEGKQKTILDGFAKVSDKVSLEVLIQLYDHFLLRENSEEMRYFTYERNGMAITHAEPDNREPISKDVMASIIKMLDDAIASKEISHQTPEGVNLSGNVYVSDSLSQYRIPSSARTSSSSVKTLPRGSKIKLDELSGNGKFIRVFTHWHNLAKGKQDQENSSDSFMSYQTRVDIDLSAHFYDKDMSPVSTVSWNTGLYSNGDSKYAVHSGDVTDAPNGASEFIDIDLENAKKAGVRYVVIVNSSFRGTSWSDIPECFSGLMIRTGFGKNAGEIYDPTSVKYKFDLTQQNAAMNIAFAYDIETNELIWIDSPFSYGRVSSENSDIIGDVILGALKPHLTMKDLIVLSTKRFGHVVTDPKQADVVFGETETSDVKGATIIRPTDVEMFEKLFM